MGTLDAVLGSVIRAAGGLVLPVRCAGCGRAGEPWCPRCHEQSRRPAPDAGRPCPVPLWAATTFDGPVRAAVTAAKDGGRSDVRPVLAALLATALGRALAEDQHLRAARHRGVGVLAVPVPTARGARRRRGEDPLAVLAASAVRSVDPGSMRVLGALRHTRAVRDQARLGAAARAANLAGALEVRPAAAGSVRGRCCVVLDDVVTTGATVAEAARALRRAGAAHVVAVAVARTPRV